MRVNANAPIMVMVLMMMAGEGNNSGTVSTCRQGYVNLKKIGQKVAVLSPGSQYFY